ncbi:unnamed protein product [Caenorhabditis brenneri]
MAPQPSTIIAQQHIQRVKKAQEVFKMKKLAPENPNSPKGLVKSLLVHSALNRVKNMETEWKEVAVVKTGLSTVDVRVLAASFDKMEV